MLLLFWESKLDQNYFLSIYELYRREKPVFHPCVAARALLSGEVEKLDVRLRELSETREVVARLLNAVDTNEKLAL